MRSAVAWFAENHVAANLLMAILLAGGLYSLATIKKESQPPIETNLVRVTVPFLGASPEDVESNVVAAIEPEVRFLDDVTRVNATAYESRAVVTIEFKEFGVGVKFVPVVLDSGRINLKLNISVSELVSGNTVGINIDGVTSSFIIPSLTKRSAISTVELADGQTIGIAGLINENLREVVTKFPALGSIPVLGALFRSQEFIKGETELLILVTPRLAKPLGPRDIRLPTDGFAEPGDLSWYLLGSTEGRSSSKSSSTTESTESAGSAGSAE